MTAAPRQPVDLAGDDLLARAVLAEDQDVGIRRRGALDQGANALHRRRFADQWRLAGRRQLGCAAALGPGVDPAAPERCRAAHRRREPFVAPRLGDEVAGAALDCFDRDRHRAVSRDDHDGRVRILLHDLAEESQAFAAVGRRRARN